jgi:NAD(P)-dependent dehydrogenase (short-subunit alcohol dehydrogenase family)
VVVGAAVREAGGLDVLVNNAGYGLFGAVEEASDAEVRRLMETNFFGALCVIQSALPVMRARGGGRIVNISSVAGFMGLPGGGLYCASKFALSGLSESLGIELAPFNIQVTSVEPGGFRTNFAGGSMAIVAQPKKEYDGTPAGQTRAGMAHYFGREPGDPRKAAAVLLKLVDSPRAPAHLVLGEDALGWARGKLQRLAADYDAWAAASIDTKLDA